MIRHTFAALAVLVLLSTHAQAQSVFLVRHAERADTAAGAAPAMATDPDLSAAGHARAETLARILRDAKIQAIYVTQYKRTQQTAAPLAKTLGLTPVVVNSKDTPGLIEKLRGTASNVLVVGHSNSVADVVKGIGIADAPEIPDSEYDNLFVVTSAKQLLRLRF